MVQKGKTVHYSSFEYFSFHNRRTKMKNCIFLFLIGFTLSAKLPEEIKLCSKSDPKINECLIDRIAVAFKKFITGYKPLGIQKLEPLSISELSTEGSGGITQIYKNIKIDGISKCNVYDVKLDWKALTMDWKAMCPHNIMTADYTLSGKIITFPLDSSGKCNISLDDIDVIHKTKLERIVKGGKQHLRIKEWKMKLLPKRVHFYFENVMPGNKQLSETILNTINENGIQIFLDQAVGFEEAYSVVHKTITNKVFDKIPEDELFLP